MPLIFLDITIVKHDTFPEESSCLIQKFKPGCFWYMILNIEWLLIGINEETIILVFIFLTFWTGHEQTIIFIFLALCRRLKLYFIKKTLAAKCSNSLGSILTSS